MERRELFSSLFSSKKKETKQTLIRPPYYEDESSFDKECINCIETPCITFCEENIIIKNEDNTPVIDFTLGGCTYCDECANACPNDVLDLEYKKNIDAIIEINMLECLAWNQTMCFSCKDPCLDDAIHFFGMFKPVIQDDTCTSCGFCISVCPTNAITIKKKEEV